MREETNNKLYILKPDRYHEYHEFQENSLILLLTHCLVTFIL